VTKGPGQVDIFFNVPSAEKQKAALIKILDELESRMLKMGTINVEIKNSKNIQEFVDAQKRFNTEQSEAIKLEKQKNAEIEKAWNLEEKRQQKEKESKAKQETKDQEAAMKKLNAESDKRAKAIEKESAYLKKHGEEYVKLTRNVQELKTKLAETILKQGEQSKAAKEVGKEFDQQREKLTKLQQRLGDHTQDVGRYGKALETATMSMGEMKQAFTELKNVSFSGKSAEEITELKQKIGDLKDAMGDMQSEMQVMGTEKSAVLVSGLKFIAAGVEGVVGSLSLFGVESGVIKKLETKMMSLIAVTQALSEIEDTVASGKLRAIGIRIQSMAIDVKDTIVKWASATATAAQAKAESARAVMTGTATVATKTAAAAQWLWNAALAANPIGLIIAGVAALAAGIVILVNVLGKNKTETRDLKEITEEYNNILADTKTKTDDVIQKLKEQNVELKKLAIQQRLTNGEITQAEAERLLQGIDNNSKFIELSEQAAVTAIKRKKIEKELTDAQKDFSKLEGQYQEQQQAGIGLTFNQSKNKEELAKKIVYLKGSVSELTQLEEKQLQAASNEYKIGKARISLIDEETKKTKKGTSEKKTELEKLDEAIKNLIATLDDQIVHGDKNSIATAKEILRLKELKKYYEDLRVSIIAVAESREMGNLQTFKQKEAKGITLASGEQRMGAPIGNLTGPAITGGGIEGEKSPDEIALQKELAVLEQRLEYTRQFVDAINELVNSIYENEFQKIDEAAAKDEENRARELKLAGDNKKAQDQINAKYDQKEAQREKEKKKLQHDQAVYQKAVAAVNIGINTAVAAMQAYAQLGPIAGTVAAVLVIAFGAIQLAAVLAQNIPSYEKGRKGGPQELAKVHRGEMIIADNKSFLTPDVAESLALLPEGADVIPASEVLKTAGRLSTQPIRSEKSGIIVNVNDKYGKEMLSEMKKEKPQTRIYTENGYTVHETGNYRLLTRV
jgi:hypothetical protein